MGTKLNLSFSGCYIILAEIDPCILQVSICESGGALPCRRFFAFLLSKWALYDWGFRGRLL